MPATLNRGACLLPALILAWSMTVQAGSSGAVRQITLHGDCYRTSTRIKSSVALWEPCDDSRTDLPLYLNLANSDAPEDGARVP